VNCRLRRRDAVLLAEICDLQQIRMVRDKSNTIDITTTITSTSTEVVTADMAVITHCTGPVAFHPVPGFGLIRIVQLRFLARHCRRQ